MTKQEIEEIENAFPTDGLTGYIYGIFCGEEIDDIDAVATLDDGAAGTVLKGTAPVMERREQFLKMYRGCRRIAEHLKKHAE